METDLFPMTWTKKIPSRALVTLTVLSKLELGNRSDYRQPARQSRTLRPDCCR